MNHRHTSAHGLVAAVLAVVVVLAAVPAPAAAQSDSPAWADDLFADLETMADRYNANVDGARAEMNGPTRAVYDQLNGRTVNVYLHGTDVTYSFRVTDDGEVVDLRRGTRDDAHLAMFLTRDTAERLTSAENPVPPFVTAVQTGRFVGSGDDRTVRGVVIRGESDRLVERAKWGVINLAKGFVF
jgi:hypothetical protein